MTSIKLYVVATEKPEDANIIIGQSHFIKTCEDIYETLVSSVPNIKFGLAFCESSGKRLVRVEGNDEELKRYAIKNALNIRAGHCFILIIKNAWPINILNSLKHIPEVVGIYCATANKVQVIVGETEQGRGILGVIDGENPLGVESDDDVKERREFLRKTGYKL